jgi:hypothetical protein
LQQAQPPAAQPLVERKQPLPAQQQPAQAAQKRAVAPGSAAEAAAAHAAKAAAARAAKGQVKQAAPAAPAPPAGNKQAPKQRSVTPAADPALNTAAAASKSSGSSRSASAGLDSGGTGPGRGVNSRASNEAPAAAPAAANNGVAGAAGVGTSKAGTKLAARGPVAAVAAESRQQHRPASALFSNCMGLQSGGQMVGHLSLLCCLGMHLMSTHWHLRCHTC